MAPTGELEGKVAIVTGSARGIGLETAKRMARGGAKVVLADLPDSDLEGALAAVRKEGEASAQAFNLADEQTIEQLFEFVLETYGALHILNNNAARQGLADDIDVMTMSAATWDSVFAANARGTMLMCKNALRPMIDAGGGSIVNISSGTANASEPFQTAYACSKGAIQTLTRCVATQYGREGIRCNCIAPGLIATETLLQLMPEAMRDIYVENKLVNRLGEPGDIAELVLFLASERSAFITGQIIAADGGFLAHVPTMAQIRALMGGAEGALEHG